MQLRLPCSSLPNCPCKNNARTIRTRSLKSGSESLNPHSNRIFVRYMKIFGRSKSHPTLYPGWCHSKRGITTTRNMASMIPNLPLLTPAFSLCITGIHEITSSFAGRIPQAHSLTPTNQPRGNHYLK